MKELVSENAGALLGVFPEAGVEMDFALANGGASDGRAPAVVKAARPQEADGFTVRW
jgi:hypothetical protein